MVILLPGNAVLLPHVVRSAAGAAGPVHGRRRQAHQGRPGPRLPQIRKEAMRNGRDGRTDETRLFPPNFLYFYTYIYLHRVINNGEFGHPRFRGLFECLLDLEEGGRKLILFWMSIRLVSLVMDGGSVSSDFSSLTSLSKMSVFFLSELSTLPFFWWLGRTFLKCSRCLTRRQ